MSTYTPQPIGSLSNEQTAVAKINENLQNIAEALNDKLDRVDGLPNHMERDLDMNSQDILNVGEIRFTNGVVIGGNNTWSSGGGGATNLSVSRTATTVTVISDTGTDATLPTADVANAGVMSAAQATKLDGIAEGATANATDAQLRDRSTHTGQQPATSVDFSQGVAGAVTRTVAAKLSEVISVKDFGAVGDGVADDTAAIQAAINEAAARGGGEVRFHAGQFRISAQLSVIISGIRLVGEGGEAYTPAVRGTEIAWFGPSGAGQTMLFFQFVDACALEGIALDCRNIAGIAVQAQGVKLSRFMNINLRNFTNVGFYGYCGDLPGQWSSTNKFENFLITSQNDGVVGLWLDGSAVENNDWFNNVFINGFIQVARTPTESRAVLLDFCDSNTFIECDFNVFASGNGVAVLFNSGRRNAYPQNNFFYGCSINSIGVNEGGGKFIGDQFFFAFTQKDGETLPTHPKLRGFTDVGQYFGEVFTLRQNTGRLRFSPRSADRSYDILLNANDSVDYGLQVIRRDAGVDTVIGQWDQQGVFYVFIPTLGIKAVQVGAADSAGTGFRTLRVEN